MLLKRRMTKMSLKVCQRAVVEDVLQLDVLNAVNERQEQLPYYDITSIYGKIHRIL
jgi:hypothetical protein